MSDDFRLFCENCVLGSGPDSLRVAAATLTVRDGEIAEIVEGPAPAGEDAPRLLRRAVLSPAFVNGHTHLALHAYRGLVSAASSAGNIVEDVFYRVEAHVRAEDVRAFARVGALESVLHGVAVVFDHYYHAESVAEAMREIGLAGVIAPTLQDLAGPGREMAEQSLDATRALNEPAWARHGIAAAVGPHATDTVSADLWGRAVALASELDVPLHAHLSQSADEFRRLIEREGCAPLAWLEREGFLAADVRALLVHALFLDAADLRRLDPSRHWLGACPYSQMQFGFPAPVDEWEQAGVPWFAGTDCVPSNDGMNVQKELRLLAGQGLAGLSYGDERRRLREGASLETVRALESRRREVVRAHMGVAEPEALLARVWSVPGDWHPRLRTGALEVGRRADLAVWDLDHPSMWPSEGEGASVLRALALGEPSPALRGLCVGGRWVGEPDDVRAVLRRPEIAGMFAEAEARRRELLARAGLPGTD